MTADELSAGLARVASRVGLGALSLVPQRLTGGAVMESWRFACGDEAFVLRRAPSLAFMEGRPYGHAVEAALIEAARAKGVTAPQVVAVLEETDGLGSGFIMRALPGTADPKVILACDNPDSLLREAARDLARIHRLRQSDVPKGVPVIDYRAAIADLKAQFMDAGGDRPIIALGLRWLEDNCPPEVEPVLNHGDYRMGNLLVEGSRLTGVLDWEIAHFGDRHEDLAFGCMAVWRFARYDRPALGLGLIEDYIAAYEAEAGVTVDPARFRFWTIYRTVWWALGCLKMAAQWRSGADRMLERVVISRRTSEQELDLLLLLEEDAPAVDKDQVLFSTRALVRPTGEAKIADIAVAISEWLATIKDKLDGHDRFQLAVARNALGIIARASTSDAELCDNRHFAGRILSGEMTLQTHGLLHDLRSTILEKVQDDSPKYPALQIAMEKWPAPDKRTEQA
ncbi:phosphotransferase [Porphyrobacter sp. LM 6]|uniref:phosphotransferase n=1 Tax=Porphyrobacter sp. LM 6 TaxID=1896196 RepID=UPI000846F6B7|nr:phosphotransferase [Porphyrobacter sp. LM 6]AOL93623.1 aminoglycoside phosphotransferase (APT) family protein [Porphyrobacter sp. LM 6]